MLEILFKFIASSRSRNWIIHVSALKDMLLVIITMDRIKYRHMLPAYLADMLYFKKGDPTVWKFFQEGNFSVQKNPIPFTAIGRNHTGEQENKKVKISRGLKGIFRNLNARTRFFLNVPILKQIIKEMQNMRGVTKNRSTLHHHLNKAHQTIQSSRVIQLVAMFDKLGLSMAEKDNKRLYNIATGKVFPEHIYKLLLSVTATGEQLLSEFCTERLSTDNKTSLFSPIKKVNIPVFRSCEKKEKVKINQTVYELQGHCNFCAQCALVASQSEIDMKDTIGHHELSSVSRSFMDSGGELNRGGKTKSKLVDVLTKHVSQSKIPASECPGADIVAIDAMQLVHKISKPVSVKTFKALMDVFCQDVEKLMGLCHVVIIALTPITIFL